MSLVDLFRPKWKHSDSNVRADAVKAMGTDDVPVLLRIAKDDPDERVREIAIKRIDDPETLIELARGVDESSLAELAVQRASGLLVADAVQDDDAETAEEALAKIDDDAALIEVAKRALLPDVRKAALGRLDDDRSLADVARSSKREDLRLAAVERIEDQAVLRGLALDGQHRGVALAALGRLEDAEALEDVAKHAKVKSVRSRASKRLAAQRPTGPEEDVESSEAERRVARHKRRDARRQTKARKLCERLDDLVPMSRDTQTPEKLDELEARWAEVVEEGAIDGDSVTRFETAVTELRGKLESVVKERAAEEAGRAEENEALGEREEIVAALEALDDGASMAAVDELESRWGWLAPFESQKAAALERRFTGGLRKWKGRQDAIEARKKIRPELEALLVEAEAAVEIKRIGEAKKELRTITKKWKDLAGRSRGDDDLEERFGAARKRLDERDRADREEKDKRREEEASRIEELIDTMEKMKETDSLAAADQLWREARDVARKASAAAGRKAWADLRERFRAAEQTLGRRVNELREADDWDRHFNLRKQQDLCEKVEALLKLDDPPKAVKALREAQKEWKKVARGPRGRSGDMWQRFKKAGDEVYAKSGEYLEGQKKVREDALKVKENICEQAEALADSTDWQATTDKLKALQAEWKEAGSVPRKKSDALWKRFRGACDAFFERRKVHYKELDGERKENLTRKKELCEKAEELQLSSEWPETADAFKGLQAKWKDIGPVPRNQSDEVWTRFRGACDHFFARREAHLDGGKQANLLQRNALCDELEAALDALQGEGDEEASPLAERIVEAFKGWNEIGPIPFDEIERTDARFESICERSMEALAAQLKGTPLDPEASARRRERLCERAEALAERASGDGASDDEESEDEKTVAERLKEAMAQNAFPEESKADGMQQFEVEADRLRKSWGGSAPVPGEAGLELKRRFDAALASVPVGEGASADRGRSS